MTPRSRSSPEVGSVGEGSRLLSAPLRGCRRLQSGVSSAAYRPSPVLEDDSLEPGGVGVDSRAFNEIPPPPSPGHRR